MFRRTFTVSIALGSLAAIAMSVLMTAATGDTRIADAAMQGDKDSVRALLKQAVDVNAAQGDGMTALHWAALNGDADLAQLLVYAGANVKATTRLGGYTPLLMASKSGYAAVIEVLLKARADVATTSTAGFTPLMMAAMSGDADSVKLLLDHGADPNAQETERGQTALGYAATFDRPEAIRILIAHGANPELPSHLIVPPPPAQRGAAPAGQAAATPTPAPAAGAATAPARGAGRGAAAGTPAPAQAGGRGNAAGNDPAAAAAAAAQMMNGADAGSKGGGNPKGALTPLMYAARQGSLEASKALLDGGAKINAVNGDNSTSLLLAIINGHFDLASFLVERGADVNKASMDGAGPLYGLVNTQWARKSFHPQPSTKYERTSYLDLMRALLDRGADPNAKLTKELWYSEYNFSLESASAVGTTAFWKCAEVGDIDGMRLLVSRGADPNIASNDGVTALLMASGAGTHGNDDVTAPPGRLNAVKYLVEELHADVNAADTGGNNRVDNANGQAQAQAQAQVPAQPQATPANAAPGNSGNAQQAAQQPQQQQQQQQNFGRGPTGGYTALHNAAARGDNDMILYLISRGAKVDAVSKNGTTVVDMANGPRQRIQPYPETVALLEMLGARNNHKCVSC